MVFLSFWFWCFWCIFGAFGAFVGFGGFGFVGFGFGVFKPTRQKKPESDPTAVAGNIQFLLTAIK